MPEKKYPPISNGTAVKTTQEDVSKRSDWTAEAQADRKWGVRGTVTDYHDSHGLCYDVLHQDGSRGCYNPNELEITT